MKKAEINIYPILISGMQILLATMSLPAPTKWNRFVNPSTTTAMM